MNQLNNSTMPIEVQIIKYTRLEGERRVRHTFFVRRREVRLITPCNYLYELLYIGKPNDYDLRAF